MKRYNIHSYHIHYVLIGRIMLHKKETLRGGIRRSLGRCNTGRRCRRCRFA